MKNPDPYLSRKEAAEWLGVTVKFMEKHAMHGDGPIFHKIGRLAKYRVSDLEKYGEEKSCSNTAQGKHLGETA